jgi:transposase-like protein
MGVQCDRCAGEAFTKAGWDRLGRQLWRCQACGRRLTTRSASAFSGYRFPDEVIALAVRWYLRFRLSYADVAEWLAERGITVDPSTIYDWVHAFTPRFIEAACRHRQRIGRKWPVDETLFKIGGRWRYAFRAIDEHGQIVDMLRSEHRNAASARAFFEQAMTSTEVTPTRVTTDKAKCYPPALRAVLPHVEHRSSRYLNNGLERDHQHLKGRARPTRHFKQLARAGTFCRGHALIRNLGQGFSDLAVDVSPRLRLAAAWTVLAAAL